MKLFFLFDFLGITTLFPTVGHWKGSIVFQKRVSCNSESANYNLYQKFEILSGIQNKQTKIVFIDQHTVF